MKVLQVIDGMHPRDGGPPSVVAGAAIAMRARGHDIRVITSLQPGDQADVEASWKRMLDSGTKLYFTAPIGVASMIGLAAPDAILNAAIEDADVVQLHGFWSPMLVSAARSARKAGKPYFISVHGLLDHWAMTASRSKWLKKQIALKLFGVESVLRQSAGLIYGSETEDQQSWDPAPGLKKFYIPNGVDADVGQGPVTESDRQRLAQSAPHFGSWKRSLLFYGRIHPGKGVDMLVTAFNAVAMDFPDTGLLIAGIRRDETYADQINELVAACPAPDRIALTTELTGPESRFVYSLCDIFILPSHGEGLSVAMIEALANGMPMLITRYCHAPQVQSVGAGVVVDPTPAAIEAGLRDLLSRSDAELAVAGQRARQLFEQAYTWDRVAQLLDEAFSSSLSSDHRAQSI